MAATQSKAEFVPRHYWLAGLRSFVLSTFVIAALYGVGLLQSYYWAAALFTLLLYGRAVARFYTDRRRLTVIVTGQEVSGPGATRWSARVAIPRSQIDRDRGGRATLMERLLGYRNIYAKDGRIITVDAVLLGPAQTAALIGRLKLKT